MPQINRRRLNGRTAGGSSPTSLFQCTEPQLVAARGPGEIKQYFIPNPFKEDTWVSSIEIRPGDPSVVHHVIVQVPEQKLGGVGVGGVGVVFKKQCNDCQQVADLQQEVRDVRVELAQREADLKAFFVADVGLKLQGQRGGNPLGGGSYSDVLVRLEEQRTGRGAFTTMEAVYAPGSPPLDFRYTDSAKLIPGGKPIRIEVHYTPNGKEETWDQTRIGFTLAKAPAQRRFVMMAPVHLVDSRKPIPAGDANYETRGELTFDQDAELVWFMPHMHLRGKDMTFRLIYPNGKEQTVLSAKFNFNWQLGYEVEDPIKVPKGTRMVVTAHHDNSANNPSNPAPGAAVPWGEMTAQEMMLPWFGVVVEGDAKPDMIASYRPGDLDGPFPANLPRVSGQQLEIIAQPGLVQRRVTGETRDSGVVAAISTSTPSS